MFPIWKKNKQDSVGFLNRLKPVVIAMFSFLFYIILLSLNFTEHYCQRVSVSLRVQKAQDIRRYMNLSVDPCDDFYEYACGNFRTEFPLENDNMYPFSTLQQVEDKVDKELLSLVIQPRQTHDDVCHQQMKDFHKSCMSLDQINRVGIEPIKTTINDLGGEYLTEHCYFFCFVILPSISKIFSTLCTLES